MTFPAIRAAAAAAVFLAAGLPSAAGQEERGAAVLTASGAALTRLTPGAHDAVRPRLSPDGRLLAYVRRDGGEDGARGEEIWVADLESGRLERRVGREEITSVDPAAGDYSLHDPAWSPDGKRLAFTWFDGQGWARVMISDPDRALVRLPVPTVTDPWESGESFTLSATQFTWESDGSGHMVVWDDDCASLHHVNVPPPGIASGGATVALPLPGGCRPLMIEHPGYWLFRTRETDFSQRVGIVDGHGSVIESRVFRQDAVVYARWGESPEAGRPPAVLWWTYTDTGETVMAVWKPRSLILWRRASCEGECPEPVLATSSGLWFLEKPRSRGRLMLLEEAGGEPREILPAGVQGLRSLPGESLLIAVMKDGDGSSGLWRLESQPPAPAP